MTIIRDLELTHACVLTEIHREHKSARAIVEDMAREVVNLRKSRWLDSSTAQWMTTKAKRLQEKADKVDILREVARWLDIDKDLVQRALGDEDLIFA